VRQLLVLPGDLGVIVDTPGLRELQLWDDTGLTDAFADLDALAAACRFRDCGHGDEPGCAVRDAVEAGAIDARRLRHWRALAREVQTHQERLAQRREWRQRTQEGRARAEWKRRL
jgi:ribosome biogenesis GTPase